jgi:hypothetical protein
MKPSTPLIKTMKWLCSGCLGGLHDEPWPSLNAVNFAFSRLPPDIYKVSIWISRIKIPRHIYSRYFTPCNRSLSVPQKREVADGMPTIYVFKCVKTGKLFL